MVIARIESFILGKGLNDALSRANTYRCWCRWHNDT